MERRLYESEVNVRSSDGGRKITGTAAVFYRDGEAGTEYDLSGYGMPGVKERIMPGAFKRALGRGQGGTIDRNQDVYAAINHDPSLVFARTKAGTLKLTADEDGLHYEAVPSDTSSGRDALAHVEAGNFGGSSFAFSVAKNGEKWTMDGKTEVREIHKIDQIVDVSPVTSPAYKSTVVNARAAEECRASYDAWKDTVSKDIDALKALHEEIGQKLKLNEAEEEEASDGEERVDAVDGECPDGYTYDEENDTCVEVEAEDEDEASSCEDTERTSRISAIEALIKVDESLNT